VVGNFDKNGFLQLGFAGHQPQMADVYTNTGSLYLTSVVFLPLGLPANHTFWTSAYIYAPTLKIHKIKSYKMDEEQTELYNIIKIL